MKRVLVADIMSRETVEANPDASLLDCVKNMVKKRVGSVMIVDQKRLVGLISQKDVLWALTKKNIKDLKDIKAIDISPRKIATAKPAMMMEAAWKKMKKFKVQRLPVLHNKELVGLISMKDILNFNPELYSKLDEFSQIKDQSDKLKRFEKASTRETVDGVCEECGNLNTLYRFNGTLICGDCHDVL